MAASVALALFWSTISRAFPVLHLRRGSTAAASTRSNRWRRRAALGGAARVSRKARRPMRLLHAGIHHGFGRIAAAQPPARPKTKFANARQQYLPLHRLRENHRGGEICGRTARRGNRAMNEIVPSAYHRRLCAAGGRAGKIPGAPNTPPILVGVGDARRAHLSQPLFACRNP